MYFFAQIALIWPGKTPNFSGNTTGGYFCGKSPIRIDDESEDGMAKVIRTKSISDE